MFLYMAKRTTAPKDRVHGLRISIGYPCVTGSLFLIRAVVQCFIKKSPHTVETVEETIMVKKVVSTAIVAVLVAAYTALSFMLCVQSIENGSLLGTVLFAFLATFGGYMSVALPVLHWQTYK